MHIVLEGIDNSGKSTLAAHLSRDLSLPICPSEGPPKYPGEMNDRIQRYLAFPRDYIFDRHPAVSQLIYGTMRTHLDSIDPALIDQFYSSNPLFIYCDPQDRGMEGHVERHTVDTPHHLAQVNENYTKLLALYRQWALKHAHFVYCIGDDLEIILKRVSSSYHAHIT